MKPTTSSEEWALLEAMFAPQTHASRHSGSSRIHAAAPSKKLQWSSDGGLTWKSKLYGSHERAVEKAEALARTSKLTTIIRVGTYYL